MTYEEAAAIGTSKCGRASRQEPLGNGSGASSIPIATSEYKAVNREKTLLAEMSILHAQSLDEDSRALREELAEMSSKHISDALDQHLAESRFGKTLRNRPTNMWSSLST